MRIRTAPSRRRFAPPQGEVAANKRHRSRAPRFFQRVRGILPSQPSFRFGSEGAGAPVRRNKPFVSSLAGGKRLAALQHSDFSARAALFVRRRSVSPSASSSRRLVVAGGGVPDRPGCAAASRARGRRSRSHSKTPRETPLMDQDARIVRPPERPGIRNPKKFSR